MSILFDITTRQAKLIELMSKKEEYFPAKYFADYLKVSERTIFNDLAKLEKIIKTFNIDIDKKPNQGIKISGDITASEDFFQSIIHKIKLEEFTRYSPLDRQVLIAKRLLMENKTITYQSLSLELYISTTSIIKDIDRIRSLIDDELKIVSDTNGTRIQGTEMGIQKSIKRFSYYLIEQKAHNYSLSSYAEILEPLFDKRVIEKVYQSVQDLIAVLGLNISEQYLKSLFISVLILTERSYRGDHLEGVPDIQFDGTEYLTNYPLAVQLCHSISSHIDVAFTELELRYISNQLFANRVEVSVNNKYIENLFSKDIQYMIADVSKAIDIDLIEDERLYNSLIYHVLPMIYRLKSDIDVFNPLLEEIKNDYGVLFRIIWYVMESLEEKYDIKLTDDDIAFITIHFRVAIERKEQMSHILVVCQTGLVTSDLIINRIKKLLPANINFKLVAKPVLKDEDLSKVDFIISLVELEDITRPVVYVSPLVRDTDLMKIYAHYLEYSATTRGKEANKLDHSVISTYLDSRYIFLNEKMTTKEECLDKMIQQLEQGGIVKKDFSASVYERENLGNTLVQRWVAVPHAPSSVVNETKIAIMTTNEPIKWNSESYVSLIILLAVAEEDIVNFRKFLGRLYKIILKSESLEESGLINSLKHPDDLISLMQDGSINPSSEHVE